MDLISQLKELAIGSRLKRLSERFFQDTILIYKSSDIEFESRWFPVFRLLMLKSPLSILDVAKALRITHPAVNQIAGEMIEKGIVYEIDAPNDKRKRLIGLTEKGLSLVPKLEKVWKKIHSCVIEILGETGYDFLDCVEKLEKVLYQESLYQRFTDYDLSEK